MVQFYHNNIDNNIDNIDMVEMPKSPILSHEKMPMLTRIFGILEHLVDNISRGGDPVL